MRKREARERIRQIMVNSLRRSRKDYSHIFGGETKEQEQKVLKEAMKWWADKLDKAAK